MRLFLCGSMAASQAERSVNIYPGPPHNWTHKRRKKANLSTYLPPRRIITSLFLILCPHTCNPLLFFLALSGSLFLSVTDYHTVEARKATSCVCSKCIQKTQTKRNKNALWRRQKPTETDGYFVRWTFHPGQVQLRDFNLSALLLTSLFQALLRTMHSPFEQIMGNLKCDNILSSHHMLPMISLQTLHLMLLPQW